MNKAELETMLGATNSPQQTASWLRGTYLPELINRFNSDETRKRLGLYQGERIPDNERNLTDVRNRVSLIVEYELARLSNDILNEAHVSSLFWSYVVANRFPDLEVRKNNGDRLLRIEVKNLQSIAEEKSANFDTLRKDINPHTDFVVVFLWEWAYGDSSSYQWDRAPRLLGCYVFHAASLAELRDTYWLNQPHNNLGSGYQGFDLRYAVNCNSNTYSEEEGNYGKLLRIWKADFPYRPTMTPILQDTEDEYLRFKAGVVMAGFWSLCKLHLPKLAGHTAISVLQSNGKDVGAMCGQFAFFAKSLVGKAVVTELIKANHLTFGVTMTEKYVSTGYALQGQRLTQVFAQKKPKLLSRQLFGLL
jgi:hypothetical protein